MVEVNFQVADIMSMISQVGFPIAVSLVCFWYIYKSDERHREEIDKLSEAVQNNTIVMQKLLAKLEEHL